MKSRSARREHGWARSLLSISSKPSSRQRYSRAITFGVVTTRERFDEVNAATDKVEQNILWSGRVEGCFGSFATHAAKATDPLTSAAPPEPDRVPTKIGNDHLSSFY